MSVRAGVQQPALRAGVQHPALGTHGLTQWMLAFQWLVEGWISVKCSPVVPGCKEPAHGGGGGDLGGRSLESYEMSRDPRVTGHVHPRWNISGQ